MCSLLDREGSDCPERRSALVDRELNRYNVDMATALVRLFANVTYGIISFVTLNTGDTNWFEVCKSLDGGEQI